MQTFREFLNESVDIDHVEMRGKAIEALTAAGWDIVRSSWDESKKGIDAWTTINGQKFGIRIKSGSSMNDISVFAMRDWSPERFAKGKPLELDGNDMHSEASALVAMDSRIMLISDMAEIKRLATDSVHRLQEAYNSRATRRVTTSHGEARIVTNPLNQESQVIVYIHPWSLTQAPLGGVSRRIKMSHGVR